MNEEYISLNKKTLKKFKFLIAILFIMIIAIFVYIIYDKHNKKIEKDNVKIEKTKTVVNNQNGVYIVDVSDVVDNVMPSIVAITSKTKIKNGSYGPFSYGRGYTTGAGSGIIINKTNSELMILTNYHVIEDADSLSVKFINDKSVDANVLGKSESKDIAIITVKLSDLDNETISNIRLATLGDSTKLKVGQGIIAIGNALGYGQSVTTGVISALNREVSIDKMTNNMIQIDAAINGGNSGGALLNSNGEVIGINSAKYSSAITSSSASIEGMGFAIPISDVVDLIDKIMNNETITDEERGYLGVSGYMITEDYSSYYDMPEGFYISTIYKDSGVDKAGLSIGNIITEIDGKKVTNFSSINEVLENKKAKEKVVLKVKYIDGKEYREKKVEVILSSYKEINS